MESWSPRPIIKVTVKMPYLIFLWTAVTEEELSTMNDISYRIFNKTQSNSVTTP